MFPIAPIEEQRAIINRADNAFTQIDHLAAEAGSARRIIDHLDQAGLAKALGGELVPQGSERRTTDVLGV
jgi:type I restriction enzyme, S subunit